jgi:hypothetical protein
MYEYDRTIGVLRFNKKKKKAIQVTVGRPKTNGEYCGDLGGPWQSKIRD